MDQRRQRGWLCLFLAGVTMVVAGLSHAAHGALLLLTGAR